MSPDLAARLQSAVPGIELAAVESPEAATRAVADAEAFAGLGRLFGPELLDAAPNLKWVHAMSAGAERFCPALAGRTGVTLTNSRGAHAVPIAEHFLLMLLGLAHRMPEFLAQQSSRQWVRQEMAEVRGRTVLILGLGNLGREIVAAAQGIGLRVVGYDPYVLITAAAVERLYRYDELQAALGQADIVVSCVPMAPSTAKMMGQAEFAAMRPGSYFINLSRGGVVDEPALVAALQSGHLAGAGLDVFAVEPLPEDSPLWSMPNVIITPHIAANTPVTQQRLEDILVENARRYAEGRPLLNQVDIARGF